jgi:hypothetical protein
MSRNALSSQQFDLLLVTERQNRQKTRQDRAGIQCPEPKPRPKDKDDKK